MARKRIIFVIVEGPSDDDALGVLLSRWFDRNMVYIHIMHCDITTEFGATPVNIVSRITNEIKKYATDNHFVRDHFQQIIHIADTDGAYAPDVQVVEDTACEKPIYHTTCITCKNREKMIDRNMRKRANLNKLSTSAYMWNSIPYRMYYMSCNLDHVLYDKLNSSDEEKERDSLSFARQYKDDISGFIHYIANSNFSVSSDYTSSWDYIKQDSRSLERHTNFGLCFTTTHN